MDSEHSINFTFLNLFSLLKRNNLIYQNNIKIKKTLFFLLLRDIYSEVIIK